jgi:hypothetical protein
MLLEIVPDVLFFLAVKRYDILGIGGLIFKDLALKEFHNLIERWRRDAWTNALQTTQANKKVNYEQVVTKTEQIAEQLIIHFTDAYRLRNVPQIFEDMKTLSVRL